MEFNFLIEKIMGNNTMGKAVKEGLTAVAAAAVLSISPASAETNKSINETKVKCETSLSCTKLANSIQAQIDELKAKGFRNLSREEKIKYGSLKKGLIAVENNKQDKQKITIDEENQKQRAYTEVKDKLASIEGSLL